MAEQGIDIGGSRPAPARRGRAARVGLRLTGLLLALPLVFALVAAVSLIDREVRAPTWVERLVEARAAELIGGALGVSDIRLRLGRDLHPRVRIENAVLRDRDGVTVAQVPVIEALISPRGLLLRRELLMQQVALSGVQVTLRRDRQGGFALSFGRAGGAAMGEAASFAGLLDAIDGAFDRPALAALEQVRADGLVVNFSDARAGRSWTVDGGSLALDLRGGQTALSADLALLAGRADVTALALSYVSPDDSHAADIRLTVTDAVAADIATHSPALSWLAVLDAPISAELSAAIADDGGLAPLEARLEIGQGAVQPNAETRPIPFDGAKIAFAYDPARQEIAFTDIGLASRAVTLDAEGRAYLRGPDPLAPDEIWTQLAVPRLVANPGGAYDTAPVLTDGAIELRLALDPFRLTLGELAIRDGDSRLRAWGEVAATPSGWDVAMNGRLDEIGVAKALARWPAGWRPGMRSWFAANLTEGRFFDVSAALSARDGGPPRTAIDFEFDDAAVRFLPRMPPLTGAAGFAQLGADGFALLLDEGSLVAPEGGTVALGGSSMVIEDLAVPRAPARFDLALAGPVPALLSVLDQPPLLALSRANLPVGLATGRAEVDGRLQLPLGGPRAPDEITYAMHAVLTDVASDVAIPGRRLTAERIELLATPEGLLLEGSARVGDVLLSGALTKAFAADSPARVEARVELSQRFLDEFGIALPENVVGGDGAGRLALELAPGGPLFSLTSDLAGLRMALPWVGWSKGSAERGRLEVDGRLGAAPEIRRLALSAPGLEAAGHIDLAADGAFEAARFDRVAVGDWLDAPVALVARGEGMPVGIEVDGGRLDLRRARFGAGAGAGGAASAPMEVALDRLVISEAIALTDFRGEFEAGGAAGGVAGDFAARLNDAPIVAGTLAPGEAGLRVRVASEDAGGVLRAAGLLPNATGGALDLTLDATGAPGAYDGDLAITDLRVRDVPAIAALLDAISVVGLLQQLDGQGLAFSNVDADFRLTPEQVIVTRSSAVGPSLGLSLDGTYALAAAEMDFQGVVSPVYLLNGIGAILTRPGEGLIGFNFNLAGSTDAPRVSVNPLSVLTPGMFREIFRRPPPDVGQ
ncbi:hypothetical protein OG2516_04371 [Oceanicola granulosus HTCC2516]|uniref:Uncharacterized protein n=1 Tax=Oceanicola granulosus (strain ATCC BAA-861 / DSM 15982 / KCTC 12143 / HTCC2516) TaxID=314256 RepID=Q2CD32_OCEGH|nr:AsmA-like C-terminal region-containing protein [Oceanicola granulosus]EAR50544.1 hypothetical protein OG2516_04371 [Oceanicola granulosus HTCC2516]